MHTTQVKYKGSSRVLVKRVVPGSAAARHPRWDCAKMKIDRASAHIICNRKGKRQASALSLGYEHGFVSNAKTDASIDFFVGSKSLIVGLYALHREKRGRIVRNVVELPHELRGLVLRGSLLGKLEGAHGSSDRMGCIPSSGFEVESSVYRQNYVGGCQGEEERLRVGSHAFAVIVWTNVVAV